MSKVSVLTGSDVSDSGNRFWNSVYFLLFAVLILLTAFPAQVSPQNFLQDDSYFYLQIASNITNARVQLGKGNADFFRWFGHGRFIEQF